MTIIDDVIVKVDVDEFIRYFGEYISQNILVWSKSKTFIVKLLEVKFPV